MDAFLSFAREQFVGLLAFFAFPIIQYGLLKWFSWRRGEPLLWFLPKYGFRLVVENISGRRTLSDLRYRAIVRQTIPKGEGSSVNTFIDTPLLEREDMFCFPGTDQLLLCFQVEQVSGALTLIHTDKLGVELGRYVITPKHKVIVDYTATIENLFNFDVKLAKRVEIPHENLAAMLNPGAEERDFAVGRVRHVW